MTTVLCIGGLDPAGRAGLLADARAVQAQGARPICIATALTFQSSRTVDGYAPVDAETLRRQLVPVLRDEPIAAVKLGQLGSSAAVGVLVELLPDVPLVVDTPLVSTSGAELFPLASLDAYRPLLARSTLVTPNADELFLLAGHARGSFEAALALAPGLARAVLVKGGHFEGDVVTDVLVADGRRATWSAPRFPGRFRGTGCRLASAIAAHLGRGASLDTAIGHARGWLRDELSREG